MHLAFFYNFLFTHRQKKFIMGRGDIKTKRGKIFSGSFGKLRPAKKTKKVVVAVKKKTAAKKKA